MKSMTMRIKKSRIKNMKKIIKLLKSDSTYLLIIIPFIPISDVKLISFLVVFFMLNSFLLFFPTKISAFLMFILIGFISIYFGMQTVYFRGFSLFSSAFSPLFFAFYGFSSAVHEKSNQKNSKKFLTK